MSFFRILTLSFLALSMQVVSYAETLSEPVLIRSFEGKLEKSNMFISFLNKWQYSLTQKGTRIAFINLDKNAILKEQIDTFVGQEIIVRGAPKYINKEPYLLIDVSEICVKND